MALNKISSEVIELLIDNYIKSTPNEGSSISDLGWSLYADTAEVNPVDGLGGTPSVTLSLNGSSPLSGTADYRLVKDASNRQGNGFGYNFNVANRHLGKVLQVTFDMELISGTYSRGDLRVSVIQDPSGTPVLIEPVNTQIELGVANQRLRHVASFQTSTTVNSYRLCVHIGSASTVAYTVDFANFKVWEPTQSIGSVITDWQSYTPTFNNMPSVVIQRWEWRRVGSNCEIRGTANNTTNPGGNQSFTLPSGLVALTNATNNSIVGSYSRGILSENVSGYILSVNNSNTLLFGGYIGSTASSSNNPLANINAIGGSSELFSVTASVPIQGWGSSVAMSSDTGDGRVVAARYKNQTSQSVSTTVPIQFNTKDYDTHNAVTVGTVSTANAWRFTAPVSGYYRISANVVGNASTNHNLLLYKNNNQDSSIGFSNAGNFSSLTGTAFLNSGEYIDIRPNTSTTFSANSLGTISVERISAGSQVIASSETVAFQIALNSGSNTTSGALQKITTWSTPTVDTHGVWSTSNNRYVIPQSGTYLLSLKVQFQAFTTSISCNILLNGGSGSASNSSSNAVPVNGSENTGTVVAIRKLIAGDYIEFYSFQNSGGSLAYATAGDFRTMASITRIGL